MQKVIWYKIVDDDLEQTDTYPDHNLWFIECTLLFATHQEIHFKSFEQLTCDFEQRIEDLLWENECQEEEIKDLKFKLNKENWKYNLETGEL